ncbi:MAG: GGDEF domain-containing protein [Eubacteriales bacterium]|nr:GGDEF domain-containing protein [Eubacteriales bacterium]
MSYYSSVILMVIFSLGVLSVLVVENNSIPVLQKRLFNAVNGLIVLSASAEWLGLHLSGMMNVSVWVITIVKAADYIFTPLTGCALIFTMQKPCKRHIPLITILGINTVLQIVSIFTGWMTVIDATHNYSHGPLYLVYVGVYVFVLIMLVVELIIYGGHFKKQNRGSLYCTFLMMFLGIGLQEIFDLRTAYIALTLGSMCLFIHYMEFSQQEMDDKITKQQEEINIDTLTGVLSRAAYVDECDRYVKGIPNNLVVYMIDINGLKTVNDTIGHEAGDELICGAAKCIEEAVGEKGKVFRIGGDEFVVFIEITKTGAEKLALSIKEKSSLWYGEKVNALSLSTGYALKEDFATTTMEELVDIADKAMYEEKKAYYERTGLDRRRG